VNNRPNAGVLFIKNLAADIIMDSKINPAVLQMVNAAAIVVTILFNSLVNILPLNGVTTAMVSDSYPNLFTPPGYVFAIWGVIYVLPALFMVYQARASERKEEYLGEIGFLCLLGAAANILWLIAFHYSYGNPSLFIFTPFPIVRALLHRKVWEKNVHLHIYDPPTSPFLDDELMRLRSFLKRRNDSPTVRRRVSACRWRAYQSGMSSWRRTG